jgi:hypothetical protein
MTKISHFDGSAMEQLVPALRAALQPVAERFEIRLELRKITYGSSQCTFAIEGTPLAADGRSMTPEAEAFRMGASFFGLTPEHLGRIFTTEQGLRFRLVGLNLRARKNRFVVADVTGLKGHPEGYQLGTGQSVPPRGAS